ncbi:MAG TPA: small multi-drug export protein [bacterium]|nr:small multi-drug export protein [bacterium]HPN43251.1 small multi-drug export protein [bacterium]
MTEQITTFLSSLPKEVITIIISTLPIIELRGAIPWALAQPPIGGGMSIFSAVFFAILGNMIPVIPLLLFFDKIYNWLKPYPRFNRIFEWLFARTRKKGKMIEKYEFWGLVVFIGIPLPMTGAWTGTLAAYIFGLNFWKSVLAAIFGLLMSATIVTLLSLGILQIF